MAKTGKCIVMFGQKRAGKSSVLEHLKRRLAEREGCLPLSFSLYEIGAFTQAAFYWKILCELKGALEAREEQNWPTLSIDLPAFTELEHSPTLVFHTALDKLFQSIGRMGLPYPLTVVLLIDEFTEIFKQIRKGLVEPDIMKTWKAAVEKRHFSSVLVGQDVMPAFQEAYPNEFGVTEDVRVTYLARPDARRLIEAMGPQHFLGDAIARILSLTAGSPFYTMMLCDRLVEYMNRTKSAVITEADIATVEQEMVYGDRRLTKAKFDGLLSGGDGRVDTGIDPDDTMRLCHELASRSMRGWCAPDQLTSFEPGKVHQLLVDLERRDVVEKKNEAYRLRVGLFQDWLNYRG
jgi:hypothetical protein